MSPTPTPSDSSGYYINQCNISYPGSTCQSYLSICPGTDPDIELFDSSTESSIGLASGFLQPGSTCGNRRELVLQFLCQVAFHPCDDDDIIHLPNRTTCEYIRDTLCPTEWLFLQNSPSFAGLLPICSTLPAVSDTPSCSKYNNDWANYNAIQLKIYKMVCWICKCKSDEINYLYFIV